MSRTISIPAAKVRRWMDDGGGLAIIFPIKVDWPEAQLTAEQMYENSMALAIGGVMPHEDLSLIDVEVSWNAGK